VEWVANFYAKQYEWADWRRRWGEFDPNDRDAHVDAAPPHLVFTSPPYASFRESDDAGFQAYWNDFDSIFSQLGRLPDSAGRLVVEMSNVLQADGPVRPVAFEAAHRLREWFEFHGEIVRCNHRRRGRRTWLQLRVVAGVRREDEECRFVMKATSSVEGTVHENVSSRRVGQAA